MLRCLQVGLQLTDLKTMSYGLVLDILTEAANDHCEYKQVASQADFDRF